VFLPLGGLLVASLAARRASEPQWLRLPRRLARRLSARTRTFLARERAFFEGEGLTLASSELVRDEIRHRFPAFRGRVETTGLPVDEERFRLPEEGERASLRRELLHVEDGAPCVLWVGNDTVRKGLGAARAVLQRLRRRKLDARLVLVGRGTEHLGGAEGVHGLGFVDDMERLYRAVDVLLAPSLEDNLSFCVLEALASGLPVVTTARNGAASYISDPVVGRVVTEAVAVHDLDGATLALLEAGMLDMAKRELRREAVRECFRSRHDSRVLELLRARGP
jgi:glycosyltransferase involved in cell wall biosynthesis